MEGCDSSHDILIFQLSCNSPNASPLRTIKPSQSAGSISNMTMPTHPFSVMRSDWNDESRKHPAMKFMEDYRRMFGLQACKDETWTDWMTEDFVLTKADGTVHKGEASWNATREAYNAFTEYINEPYFTTIETDDGAEIVGQAHIYVNLPGQPGEGEAPKVKHRRDGKERDVCIPGAFRFQYVKGKGKHGIALSRTDLHADSMPVGMTLTKRGAIKLG